MTTHLFYGVTNPDGSVTVSGTFATLCCQKSVYELPTGDSGAVIPGPVDCPELALCTSCGLPSFDAVHDDPFAGQNFDWRPTDEEWAQWLVGHPGSHPYEKP